MSNLLEDSARQGHLVIMAGAGLSAGKPSALPGWNWLNAMMVQVLSRRLESALNRPGWVSQIVPTIDAERTAGRFPPDYQAQVIEEMCGERYFCGLQALDVDAINAGHDGIAVLAAAGALCAVVTTNFDRLIEHALDQRQVPYVVARDDAEYVKMLPRLIQGPRQPLPILKIHGCVSEPRSMIDTLKQRKRGRSQHLQACLDALQSEYWLYLGFSAADLETDPHYLGLVDGAAQSRGATFVAYPPSPNLGKGAQLLMNAYADRGQVVKAYIAACLGELCQTLGIPGPTLIPDDVDLGSPQFQRKIETWANTLSPAAVGLCLAAMLESIGQAEPAVRILDRLVRKELYGERDTADFRTLQLHYGRLGAVWGRFVAVPDLNGAASNASVETTQSLLRLTDTELGFAANAWLACLWLWLNQGQEATVIAARLLDGFYKGQWDQQQPRTDEEAVDAWLSAAQVFILNANTETITFIIQSAKLAHERAKQSGDVVRTARVLALQHLALAEANEDVPTLLAHYQAEFAEAARVGDGFALGMRALALGRWYTGRGGITLAATLGNAMVARQALALLAEAIRYFGNQGMDPWVLFAQVQQAKAYADLQQFDQAQTSVDIVAAGVQRFPILASHFYEVVGQIQSMGGNALAMDSFVSAIESAEQSGLVARRETLQAYLQS